MLRQLCRPTGQALRMDFSTIHAPCTIHTGLQGAMLFTCFLKCFSPSHCCLMLPPAFWSCCWVPGRLHGEKENQRQEITCGTYIFFPLSTIQNRWGKDLGFIAFQRGPRVKKLMNPVPLLLTGWTVCLKFFRNICRNWCEVSHQVERTIY